MKNILLLGSLSTDQGESKAMARMVEFVIQAMSTAGKKVIASFCHIDELAYIVNNNDAHIYDLRNQQPLETYDLIFFRGKVQPRINDAALVSYFLQKKGIPTVNTAYKDRRAVGKVPQMYQMRDLGLPIPDSVSAPVKHLPVLIEKYLGYPAIVKDIQGSHGSDNYLVKSQAELEDILQKHPDVRFIAQEFIPNDCDYRILIAGPEQIIIKRQGQEGSHLNNTSQGGTAVLVNAKDFPAEIIEQARKYAASCQYEIAGVDAIIDSITGKHYFLEINSQPQIASGAFVDEKSVLIGDYFSQLLGITESK